MPVFLISDCDTGKRKGRYLVALSSGTWSSTAACSSTKALIHTTHVRDGHSSAVIVLGRESSGWCLAVPWCFLIDMHIDLAADMQACTAT